MHLRRFLRRNEVQTSICMDWGSGPRRFEKDIGGLGASEFEQNNLTKGTGILLLVGLLGT